MKPVYIASGCAISPQHSYEADNFLNPVLTSSNGQLYVADPDYRQYINPVAIRRMGRQLKMGITAGMEALNLAGITTPHAIITGTGLGSMTDTERFLNDMIAMDEGALNPTFFIQSTYNSVNGWLALQSKCTGYNQTYVNRGLSMEMALLDAQMLLSETDDLKQALVGGFDEMTPEYYLVKSKADYWKKTAVSSSDLYHNSHTPGTIGGEGAAFFVLSNHPNAGPKLPGIKMLQQVDETTLADDITTYMASLGLNLQDIDLVISGADGDSRHAGIYKAIESLWPPETGIARYKHWTGEYPTSSGFALWLALKVFKGTNIHASRPAQRPVRRIAIINYYLLGTASIMIIEQ
jgi:3-oxoacyl-[acyl-carrier-protein] synthase II